MTESELLLYGGIGVMVLTTVSAIACMVVFLHTGRRLKKKLEQEYGKLKQ